MQIRPRLGPSHGTKPLPIHNIDTQVKIHVYTELQRESFKVAVGARHCRSLCGKDRQGVVGKDGIHGSRRSLSPLACD
jgi:hypothetical protein